MAEIRNRENNPVRGVEYSEIYIPDEENIGTGTFTTVLEPEAIINIIPIVSSIINEPAFQLFVNINYADDEVTVLIGRADNSPPLSREVFILPKKFDVSKTLQFDVVFTDWKITELKMNGNNLDRVSV